MTRWIRLGGIATIAASVWLLAAGLGGYRLLAEVPGRMAADRAPEDSHRNSAWSPIYGFADVCLARLPAGATVLLVDPTGAPLSVAPSQRTGPAAFGLPGDLDWPNQAVFAYVLYPRPVSAVGHYPSESGVAGSTYIAIWEQGSFRSQQATASARQVEATLRSSPGRQEVCVYSSAAGDRGVIFSPAGASLQSTQAATAPAAPPGGRAGAYARVLLGLGSLWLLGFVLVRLVSRGALPPLLSVGLALPLGCMSATLQLLAYSLLGARWSGPALAAPWLGIGAVVLWRDRVQGLSWLRGISLRTLLEMWRGLGAGERLALAGLTGIILVITAAAPFGLPWSDGLDLYYFKARAFFTDGSVIPYYQHAGDMLFSFPAHPPLVPMSVTWLYLFLGEVDEHASLLLWPALYLSMLVGFYALVRTALARSAALWYTLALALVGYELSTQAMLGSFADLPLAVFLLFGGGAFWAWVRSERRPLSMLAVAGFALVAAVLTKEEGLVAALVILAATPLLLWREKTQGLGARWLPLAIALPLVAAAAGFWLWLRSLYQLPELTVHLGGSVSVLLHRLVPAFVGLGARALLPLLPFLVLAGAALLIRNQLDGRRLATGRFWFLLVVATVLLGVDAAAIAATTVEVHHQVAIAATRLVSQVLPLFFLGFAEVWASVIERVRIRAVSFGGSALPAPVASGAESA